MNEAQVTQTAVSWVRRARAGDQVAMAALKKARIDVETGKATPRTRLAYQAAAKYIRTHPAEKYTAAARQLGAPVEMSSEATLLTDSDATAMLRRKRTDDKKPPLPKGYLQILNDPSQLHAAVIGAAQYRDGVGAAVVALAAGEPISKHKVRQLGGIYPAAKGAAFMHGAQFSGEDDWNAAAPKMPRDLQACMLVGQCVGRAYKLQQLRREESDINDWDPVVGWELEG